MACKPYRYDRKKDEPRIVALLRRTGDLAATARAVGTNADALRQVLYRWGVKFQPLLDAGRVSSREAQDRADKRALEHRIKQLEKELKPLREAEERRVIAAESIHGAIGATISATPWTAPKGPTSDAGIPTLMLGDLHINETVDQRQILDANAFSPAKAKERLKACFAGAVDLGCNHMVRPGHDGIEVPVGGDLLDLLGGSIHSSERQAKPIGVDAAAMVADLLQPGFLLLADAFGTVRSRWVTGNHGRLTFEMPYQDRTAKSLDAAVYHILAGRLRGDKRFTFELAPGPRLIYQVYGTRFMLLHGDPASGMPRGGDSEAGAANIVARGVKRLRSLHLQIGMPFDVALINHFHVHMRLPGAITNGSLPGYSEYAFGRASPWEPPQQVMFFTHPKWGITCTWPIYLERPK